MQHKVLWLMRLTAAVVVGVSAGLHPPHGTLGTTTLVACGIAGGLGMVAWILIDRGSPLSRFRDRWLPAALGVVAVAGGFAAATGSSGDGGGMVALTAIALVAAGVDLELAWSVTLTVLGILALEIGGLVFPDASLGALLGYAALMVACLLLGRNRRGIQVQAEQAAALLAQQQRLQEEQRRGDVLDERARIAREIHDVLAHSLGALGIQIQAARAVLTDHRDIDRALEVLGTAQRMASDGLVETRRAVHALRVDTLPLHEELARLADTHRQRYHVSVGYQVEGTPAVLPPDTTVALLRTAQEALVNAAKHAAGEAVSIGLEYGAGDVRLTVASDLPADAADAPAVATVDGGYGLTGMRERLRLLSGALHAGPRDNQWVVIAELPLATVAMPATP
jgi:signal transduction histidine kinase